MMNGRQILEGVPAAAAVAAATRQVASKIGNNKQKRLLGR